ncbi:MAG: U32 family peptidase [Bacilli bacterium]|nr:U32 family peptidase [Bacilli bacterium]
MKRIELLAPSGNLETLKVAIAAGADAVYIGGYAYSARSYADNFSNEEIIEAINYAHLYGVKIYVTVNTLIYDDEVETFINYIDFLHKNNVDAIIIQDLGMFDLIHKIYPNLEIHASTQMHIHNMEGVKFAQEHGFKRVVLARETSIDMIKKIRENCAIDLEVFCHGALCVSYSGECLMSSLIGGRSGNRGCCAGTCRLPYDLVEVNDSKQTVLNKDKYLLSMKDLNSLEHISELIESGITSLKIEGRMKRPEYIYLVVSIYRKAIDNYYKYGKTLVTDKELIELKKIYHREFTKGFLFNEENAKIVNQFRPNHQGIKIGNVIKQDKNFVYIKLNDQLKQGDGIRIVHANGDVGLQLNYIYKDKKLINLADKNDVISIKINDKVSSGDSVLKTTDINQLNRINELLKNHPRKVEISGYFEAKIGQPFVLKISDSKNTVVVASENVVSVAKTNPMTNENISKQLKKLGNTIYEMKNLDLNIDDNIFISIKDLNELRRGAIKKLNDLRQYKIIYIKKDYYIDVPNFEKEKNINYLINTKGQYEEIKNKDIKYIYVQDDNLFNALKFDNRVIKKVSRVNEVYKNYDGDLLVGEIGSLNFYNNISTDFSLNVTNSYTVAFLHSIGVEKITLSYELSDDQIKGLLLNYKKRYNKHPNLELIIYGKEEMMISKFNLLKMYKKNGNNYYLKDRYHKLYNVRDIDNLMYIYNYKERDNLKRIDDYFNMGINNLRINLLDKIVGKED